MCRAFKLVTLACAIAAPRLLSAPSTSGNYAIATSFEAGGERVTSLNYEHNVIVTPLSGRSVAVQSVVMVLGFGSQLNNGPTALDDLRSHPFGAPASITASSLLANDFDPDGDPLSFVSADAQTQRGGTIAVNGQILTYTPPAGLNDYDQFSYVAADVNGDLTSATVVLGIAPPVANQPNNTVAIVEQPDGQYLLRFRHPAGRTIYAIEFKHDLNQQEWQTLKSIQAGADGIVEALFEPTVAPQTFFRAVAF